MERRMPTQGVMKYPRAEVWASTPPGTESLAAKETQSPVFCSISVTQGKAQGPFPSASTFPSLLPPPHNPDTLLLCLLSLLSPPDPQVHSLAKDMSIARAAKIPARPWPLRKRVL